MPPRSPSGSQSTIADTPDNAGNPQAPSSPPSSGVPVCSKVIGIYLCALKLICCLQPKVVEELMDEIRRLKSLLVKHEKRIRALEARAASTTADSNTPGSANSSMVTDSPASPSVINQQHGENHVTHDTNANVAKTSTEDMAPDEV